MNPIGLVIIALGLILIIIGFKGSQHSVIAAFKGVKSDAAPTTKSAATGGTTPSTGKSNPTNNPIGTQNS